LCNALAGPRLAKVEVVFAAVATGPIGLLAFINKTAMTVALSQFRVAFRGGGECGKSCHRHKGKYQYRSRSDPDMRHANFPCLIIGLQS
jgi:hypothetical protein